jgi:hypothetical protein
MAYHLKKIKKGKIGELSKIQEELDELKDAESQKCKILAMVELSDMYGAMELYAKNKFDLSMEDIKKMSDITQRAFKSGVRKSQG